MMNPSAPSGHTSERSLKKILALDDEPEVLKLYEHFLAYCNYIVMTTDNAETFLEEMKLGQPDLVILDINLPGVSGLSLLEMIRADSATRSLPIIIVSARGDEETIKEAVKLGCDNFMVKPFKMKDFIDRVEKELYTLDETELREILSQLKMSNNNLLKNIGVHTKGMAHYDAYPLTHNDKELCVIVRRGAKPATICRHDMEKITKEVVVYCKSQMRWRIVFPSNSTATLFNTPAAL
jgi:CheY-like chemotaxis protein